MAGDFISKITSLSDQHYLIGTMLPLARDSPDPARHLRGLGRSRPPRGSFLATSGWMVEKTLRRRDSDKIWTWSQNWIRLFFLVINFAHLVNFSRNQFWFLHWNTFYSSLSVSFRKWKTSVVRLVCTITHGFEFSRATIFVCCCPLTFGFFRAWACWWMKAGGRKCLIWYNVNFCTWGLVLGCIETKFCK